MQSNEKNGRDFYALAWRWHFYAGLFVAPFMILLALTGIVYLFKPQLDALLYPQLLRVEAGAQMRSADQLLAGVRQAHPQAAVSQYACTCADDRCGASYMCSPVSGAACCCCSCCSAG